MRIDHFEISRQNRMLEETFAATFDSDSDWFELAMNVNIAKHAAVLRRAVGHTCMPGAHVPDDGCAFRQDELVRRALFTPLVQHGLIECGIVVSPELQRMRRALCVPGQI
ncbi:MAG TPA: hypothetical protein EYN27_00795 [Rhodospirillales bacterium]|nr:hypothetical protein [Rhodospirillales bacterium]